MSKFTFIETRQRVWRCLCRTSLSKSHTKLANARQWLARAFFQPVLL